ncbi:Twin-arginine translocation pathway, signal sequence, bacterial/archaeal [uncultured Caudovirales phage]|uniref:Twin-arginine translocation pathway, signal sequence, bacterial/archaeal n=1 Tax=uncultured Caudovirales phage TaxID=2100421 RepID=A0A6J5T2Q7_9CAUD|nr:Twin-arginine translocation pathway, signal sequence, bacterial/archaeal [uncultured Caudovirales phage]
MKPIDFIPEKHPIVQAAESMHMDHEVQMAREECYHSASNAMELHRMLKKISEEDGLPGWASEKITLANDYLRNVKEWLEYELGSHMENRVADENMNTLGIVEEDMSRRGFLKGAGAAAATAAAPELAKAADQTDPNKLMASMLMGGEYKEFDLTPMIEKYNWVGAPKQVIIQADKWLSNFLRQRGNMYSNLKIKYKGITMNSSKIGDVDAPDAEFESTSGASSSGGMATNMGGQQAGELFGGRPKSRTSK